MPPMRRKRATVRVTASGLRIVGKRCAHTDRVCQRHGLNAEFFTQARASLGTQPEKIGLGAGRGNLGLGLSRDRILQTEIKADAFVRGIAKHGKGTKNDRIGSEPLPEPHQRVFGKAVGIGDRQIVLGARDVFSRDKP